MKELKTILDKQITQFKKIIIRDISLFLLDKNNYKVIEYSNNFLAVLRKTGGKNLKCIGFPFPLRCYDINNLDIPKGVNIKLFLRGTAVRNFQREQLISEIRDHREVIYKEIDCLEDFKKITAAIVKKYDSCSYYDPYSFIGDSFIGLYFLKQFLNNFKLQLKQIYSENYINLLSVVNSSGYTRVFENNKLKLNIFADLIDNQWDRTKHLTKKLALRNQPTIIIGRDLIVLPIQNKILIYHYNRENVLLREGNIEDYMNDCLIPFLNIKDLKYNPRPIENNNIIINPFGSEELKTIPYELTFKIIKNLKQNYSNSKILIISGFKYNYNHLIWISKLRGELDNLSWKKDIIFKNYGSFSEIKNDLLRYKIGLAITADTSIAHFFNEIQLTNLTLYNLNRCDLSNMQSISSDGPLGFARYGKIQYPCVFFNNSQDLILSINNFLKYFMGEDKKLTGIINLFKKNLVKLIKTDNPVVLKSIKKLNPEYKLKND